MTLYWVDLQRRDHQWLVVVVDRAAGRHRDGVPRPVLPDRRPGRDRQPPAAAIGMSGSILRVERLRVSYDHPLGAVRAVDEVSFCLAPARALRPGRRVRVRQVDHGAGDPAHDQAARPDRGRRGLAGGHRLVRPDRRRDAPAAAGRHRDGPARLDELAQPGDAHPRADRRRAGRPRRDACRKRDIDARVRDAAGARSGCRRRSPTCTRTSCPAA